LVEREIEAAKKEMIRQRIGFDLVATAR